MKYITNLLKTLGLQLKNFKRKEIPVSGPGLPEFSSGLQTLVGRWRIENCNIKINRKIDLSNEDHCGACGNYMLEKIENKNKTVYLVKEFEDPRISGFKEIPDINRYIQILKM
jgi:hypothetical protein